jgi:23S rRNA (adenine2503-C2)-methyltransferase
MACAFCATGQMGLRNNLSAGEIAAQVVWARRAAARLPAWTPRRVTNVVFMGMGEPFANERASLGAVARLTDPRGMRLGSRHITISTVGVVPAIRRLPDANDQVRLAVSLHAADDALRSELVPANRLWGLERLIDAIASWRERTHHRPSLEWVMIDGVNDTDEQARELVPIARRLHAHVNLIPLNATPGFPMRGSPPARIRAFAGVLERAGVNVTVRDTRGREIEAACGQLRVEHERAAAS